jgi:hypothetical protein
MNITVVGAGALGAVYGTKLAHAARVVFVVRDLDRAPRLIHIDRINGPAPHGDVLDAPLMATDIPADTHAVLCTVRVDQIDGPLVEKLARANVPVLMLAPVLPPREAFLRDKLGDRYVAAMPGVIAYEPTDTPHERRVRYWMPKSSPTLIAAHPELVGLLHQVGLPAEMTDRAGAIQSATTIAFFPILTGIAAAGGSIDAMANNKEIMKLGFAATKESRALAKTVGELPSWANLFFKFSSPLLAKAGIKLGQSKAPEAFVFLEKHFGSKLAAQNVAVFHDIEVLANERGIPIDATRRLVSML